eukprot:301392-Prymnesium_polylepis.1
MVAGAAADAAGDARRAMLLAQMNEGEDCAMAAHQKPTSAAARTQAETAAAARSDPAIMLELMRESAAKAKAKKQRLGALKRGGGGGDDYAGGIGREYMDGAGAKGAGRRDARDAGDYMKPDSNF